jgi:hypothetical protein
MPSKIIKVVCPLCNQKFDRREDSVKRALATTGYWACKICTLIKRNKENAKPIGAKRIVAKGYVEIKTKSGWVREHRYVMSQCLDRELKDNEIVHHDNDDKSDNEPDNLVLMIHGDHTSLHNTGREVSMATKKKMSESTKRVLGPDEEREVRQKYKAWEYGYSKLAKEYGVSGSVIVRIVKEVQYAQ